MVDTRKSWQIALGIILGILLSQVLWFFLLTAADPDLPKGRSFAMIFIFVFFFITLLLPTLISIFKQESYPKFAKASSVTTLILSALPLPILSIIYFWGIAYPSILPWGWELLISLVCLFLNIKLALLPIWSWPLKQNAQTSAFVKTALVLISLSFLSLYYLGSRMVIMI